MPLVALTWLACASPAPVPDPLVPEEPQLDERQMLAALGYTAEAEDDDDAGGGVVVHRRDAVAPGTNLVVSGHDFELQLLDMDGALLHRWTLDPAAHGSDPTRRFFRRAWLLDDGSVLALIEYHSLWRIAADGEVLWHVEDHNHHDVHLAPDGLVYSLTARETRAASWTGEKVAEDAVTVYTLDGERQRSVSILEAVARSPLAEAAQAHDEPLDPLHVNSLQVLKGVTSSPAFADGRVLLSARAISRIFVLDLDEGRVVWSHAGDFHRQHEARALPSGRLLLFDNGRRRAGSRALELELPSMREAWTWTEPDWFSACCGTTSRLANGHTMVVSTNQGRAVEVTPDGEIVWDYRSGHRTPEDKIAKLFDVIRAPPVEALSWLEAR